MTIDKRIAGALVMAGLVVLASCAPAPPTPTPTLTLLPTDTDTPVPTVSPTIPATAAPTRTPLPSVTPTDADAIPTPAGDAPEIAEGVPPPYAIDVPDGWGVAHNVLPVRDITQEEIGVPVAIYSGPIPADPSITGWIVVLWGFPRTSSPNDSTLWADGLRFLRGVLLDASCNVGTDLQRTFDIGGRDDAVGTFFTAVGCRGEADTAGWFAGLTEEGGNYVFFTYVEPLAGIDTARADLQAILDSIAWYDIVTETPGP